MVWWGNRLKASVGLADLKLPHMGGCIGGGGGSEISSQEKGPAGAEPLIVLWVGSASSSKGFGVFC